MAVILRTKDYSKFSFFDFNRKIVEANVKLLMEDISENGYEEGKPIIVTADCKILDGQNRFEACKRLGEWIYYTFSKTDDPHLAVIRFNTNQRGWKLPDYIDSWASTGVKCYQQLKEFEEKNRFGTSNSLLIFLGNVMDGPGVRYVKEGKVFKVNPKAEELAEFVHSCSGLVPYYKSAGFIKAISRVHKVATKKQMDKIQAGLVSLPQQATPSAYIACFENIVNRGLQNKNRVSFSKSLN